jgi:hypothetical protein
MPESGAVEREYVRRSFTFTPAKKHRDLGFHRGVRAWDEHPDAMHL